MGLSVSDVAHPSWRGLAVGVYRLWRDSGYAIGALLAGILADLLGVGFAIGVVGALTFLSGVVVAMVMRETLPKHHRRTDASAVVAASVEAKGKGQTPPHL